MKVVKDIFLMLMCNPWNLHNFQNDLLFLSERMKTETVEELVANLYDKKEYVIRIRNLKQALDHRLVLKQAHRTIRINQNAWLKLYTDINTDLQWLFSIQERSRNTCI